MEDKIFEEIFKNGSKTYYNSSIFFPKKVRNEVFKLYAFVRTADDFVDAIPQNSKGYFEFKSKFENAYHKNIKANDLVIDSFVALAREKDFEEEWIYAFLTSMEMDISKNTYKDASELETYIYGSAEVVGLMMARILNLKEESYEAAKILGKAFQYINFLRDIFEDLSLKRTYFPQDEMKNLNLSSLSKDEVIQNKENFCKFVTDQITKYKQWQEEAEKGFKFIPKKYLIPIKTASDMYKWTADVIEKDPFVVFEKKIKPTKFQVVSRAFVNLIKP